MKSGKSRAIRQLWLAGARVWIEWNTTTRGYLLWDFAGYDEKANRFLFIRRVDGINKLLTGPQLHAQMYYFKPFLIDTEKLDLPDLVVDRYNTKVTERNPPPNAS